MGSHIPCGRRLLGLGIMGKNALCLVDTSQKYTISSEVGEFSALTGDHFIHIGTLGLLKLHLLHRCLGASTNKSVGCASEKHKFALQIFFLSV